MTIEEKAGMMFYTPASVNSDGSIEEKPGQGGMFAFVPNALKMITEKHITHFNLFVVPGADSLAIWYNACRSLLKKQDWAFH